MRRGLVWALSGTLVLTVVSLWMTRPSAFVEAVSRGVENASAPNIAMATTVAYPRPSGLLAQALPTDWPLQALEASKRDLFQPVLPPAPPPPPVVMQAPPPPAQPPAPMAPPINYRFYGQMLAPDGTRIVYLSRGDVPIRAAVGEQLDDGYVIESVSAEGVQLLYPPLGQRALIAIAPAQP